MKFCWAIRRAEMRFWNFRQIPKKCGSESPILLCFVFGVIDEKMNSRMFLKLIGTFASGALILNASGQNYTQTSYTTDRRPVYINTGPQNPLLNNAESFQRMQYMEAQTQKTYMEMEDRKRASMERLADQADQVLSLYYRALNSGIPDLVISGTCASIYNSAYSASPENVKLVLIRDVQERIDKILRAVPNVNRANVEIDAKGIEMFVILNCAKGGTDQDSTRLVVRSMYSEIKGLLENEASRSPSFGNSIYNNWELFYRQMVESGQSVKTKTLQ